MKWSISRCLRFQTSTTGSRKGSPLTSSRSRAHKLAIFRRRSVWRELVDGLPKGLPAPGDRGLDNTHTWGRTYWGGALFCLMADIEIHQRTNNRYGLQDALRGIVRAGGNMEHDWPLARALKAGDEATGVPVLMELYDRMKATPVTPDLPRCGINWVFGLPAIPSCSIKAHRSPLLCDRLWRSDQTQARPACR